MNDYFLQVDKQTLKRKLEREEIGNEKVEIDLEKGKEEDQELVKRNGKEEENKVRKNDKKIKREGK